MEVDEYELQGDGPTLRSEHYPDAADKNFENFGDHRLWVEVPSTRGEYSSSASNYRVLQRDFADHPHVRIDSDAVYFDVETRDPELLETVATLESYPVLDDSDWSELESERENDAWDDWIRDDFYRALDKKYPAVSEVMEFSEFLPDDGAMTVFGELEPEFSHDAEGGVWVDIDRLISFRYGGGQGQYEDDEELLHSIALHIFYWRAWEAKKALTNFVGVNEHVPDEKLFLLTNLLWDLGYQARNALGTARSEAEIDALAQKPPVPEIVAKLDADSNAEVWYQYLAERWIGLTSLRDGAASSAEAGEEEFASWLQAAEPFLDPEADVIDQAESLGGMIENK